MKLTKKTITILLTATMLGGLISCGSEEKPDQMGENPFASYTTPAPSQSNGTPSNPESTTAPEGDPEGNPEGNPNTPDAPKTEENTPSEPTPGMYENESAGMTACTSGNGLVKNLAEAFNCGQYMFTVNKDGNYCNVWGNEIAPKSEVSKILNVGSKFAYYDTEGNLHIEDNEASFKGIEEPVFFYMTWSGFSFIHLNDGEMHYSAYKADGTEDPAYPSQRLYVCIDNNELYRGKVTNVFLGDNSAVVWLEDGRCFYSVGMINIMPYNKNLGGEKVMVLHVYNALENAERCYDVAPSYIPYYSPVYSKTDDTANLYVQFSRSSKLYDLQIKLPEGYTTNDVKNVVLKDDIIVEFADGGVYYMMKADANGADFAAEVPSVELREHKELTKLGKAGHVKGVFESFYGNMIVALLDDGCIYRLALPETEE